MNMINTVNYAIMRAFFSRPVEEQNFNASPVDNEDLARAAIKAMREPTEEMIVNADAPDMPAGGDVKEIYRSMIDAALKE